MKSILKRIVHITLTLFLTVAVVGCATGTGKKSGSAAPPAESKPTAVYYEFDDVLVPTGLKVLDDATFIVSTPGYKSGIMTLSGRLDKDSLFNFFTVNMLKDNWTIVSQIKSPASTILVFQKASRWSVITIREKEFYTYVEVGIAPTQGVSDLSGVSEKKLFD